MESLGTPSPDAPATVATLQAVIVARTCRRCDKPLTGRQRSFCSRGAGGCSGLWWDEKHPRLGVDPRGPRTEPLWRLILGILTDGKWHSAHDLAVKLHADKHSIVSRISELTRRGHDIRTDLKPGNAVRPHKYRLYVRTAA